MQKCTSVYPDCPTFEQLKHRSSIVESGIIEYQETSSHRHPALVRNWLWIGVFMITIQVMIGGITRLTGSGLSITKWEIAIGTMPPVGERAWNDAFDLYKQTPQYHKINKGMTMSEFKFIYFWEYFHRLWARTLGFVFIIPFCWFLYKKMIRRSLMHDLIIIVLLGALVGVFGWIMVASGLINRPWVNAYKLTLHLNLAFLVYAYLFWTTLKVTFPERKAMIIGRRKNMISWISGLLIVQLILGGIVSGMKAGLWYSTWPLMNGVYVPHDLLEPAHWTKANFIEYDSHTFAAAFFQFFHRNVAYLLFILGVIIFIYWRRSMIKGSLFSNGLLIFFSCLCTQLLIGILTVINCKGSLPVFLGVMHQLGAIALISSVLYLNFRFIRSA